MLYEDLIKIIQSHFEDGLALVVGSGLSAAEGLSGMSNLASYLYTESKKLSNEGLKEWNKIQMLLDRNYGLESALYYQPPTSTIENWIISCICNLLIPEERDLFNNVFYGHHILRLSKFLDNIIVPSAGLSILTPNYDRIIEFACELSGYHVDTTALGLYAGYFDNQKSCMASCRGVRYRGKNPQLVHCSRAVVLKPHGSLDWYRYGDDARRCSIDLDQNSLIIPPGLNKYQAGYRTPFDKHRELANDYLNKASRFLVIGYGFNDDHLQTHLVKRIKEGVPTLIMTRSSNEVTKDLCATSKNCICLSKPQENNGVLVQINSECIHFKGPNIWDLGVMTEEALI